MARIVTFRFDDGFAEGARKAVRLLVPDCASFFVVADRVLGLADLSQNPRLSGRDFGSVAFWREMSRRGHDVQPHSYSHPRFPALSLEAQRAEITASVECVRRIGEGPRIFAFPFNLAPEGLDMRELGLDASGFASQNSSRGVSFNKPLAPGFDWFSLKSWAVRERDFEAITAAIAVLPDESWTVFEMHSLDGEGHEPWSSAAFAQLVSAVRGAGLTISTAADVLRKLKSGHSNEPSEPA